MIPVLLNVMLLAMLTIIALTIITHCIKRVRKD